MARRYEPRRARINRSYSVAEVERLFGVHRNSVLRWISLGLELIESKRPFLIHGSALRAFLTEHNPRKQPCGAGELYCVKCRAPRRPAFDAVDYLPKTATTGTLQAICPICATLIYRAVKRAKVTTVCAGLSVSYQPAQERIIDSPTPSLNSASSKDRI